MENTDIVMIVNKNVMLLQHMLCCLYALCLCAGLGSGRPGWGYEDNADSLMNVESMNVNIDDCDMRMKPGYEIDIKKKQKSNIPDALKKIRRVGSSGLKVKTLCEKDRNLGSVRFFQGFV